jgi:N-acetylmuramoyl-L-alanine amidase
MYPPAGTAIAARDSNFIFGSTGSGRASLRINGATVPVAPNGAFLAFLPVPPNGVYHLEATRGTDRAALDHTVQVPGGSSGAPARAAITSVAPGGARVVAAGERLLVSVRGTPGARVSVVLPDGSRHALVESRAGAEPGAADNFRTESLPPRSAPALYRGMIPVTSAWRTADTSVAVPAMRDLAARLRAEAVRDDTMERAAASAAGAQQPLGRMSSGAVVELVAGVDTVRRPLRLNVEVLPRDAALVGVVQAPANAPSDWRVRGRIDTSGPFHYFWPAGTRLHVTGEENGFYRVRLTGDLHAYVPVEDVRLLAPGNPSPGSTIAAVRFRAQPDFVDLRIPLSERLPFRVEQSGRTLILDVFGAVSQVNFFQYGSLDPLLEHAQWSQPADDVYRVAITLTKPVWGYDTFFDAGDALVLRLRRAPDIDPERPLAGLLVAVDAGHPPGGAIGPTGLTEAEANLGIALHLQSLLEQAGARVLMTRTDATAVELGARPRAATEANAHLLVSVHNNAFPDGVNPFTSNGTSAYYYHPHSVDLAQRLQAELLRELGLRDIGIGRADLALVRPTWMPAVLTETMFLMIPEQEAALRDPAVQRRIAEAHVRGITEFLRTRADAR